MIVQYLSRILFSFNYKKSSKYFIGLFGGLAATSIIYFMLIKGLKTSSFMTGEFKDMVYANTGMIVLDVWYFYDLDAGIALVEGECIQGGHFDGYVCLGVGFCPGMTW